jgi:hypothetical protein
MGALPEAAAKKKVPVFMELAGVAQSGTVHGRRRRHRQRTVPLRGNRVKIHGFPRISATEREDPHGRLVDAPRQA